MTRLRGALGPIVAIWLSCHVGQLVAVPVVLWTASDEALLECTCSHGDHAMCPMHHAPAPGTTRCVMQGTDGADAVALSSALAFIAVPPEPQAQTLPDSQRLPLLPGDASLSSRPLPPEPPPPRI